MYKVIHTSVEEVAEIKNFKIGAGIAKKAKVDLQKNFEIFLPGLEGRAMQFSVNTKSSFAQLRKIGKREGGP